MQVNLNRIALHSAFALLLLALANLANAQYAYNILPIDAGVYGLNNKGQIAITQLFQLQDGTIVGHAGYYDNGVYYDSQPGSHQQSFGTAISDSGLLALSVAPNFSNSPALYNINTGQTRVLTAYGNHPVFNGTNLNGINAAGDVAVQQEETSSIYHYSTGQIDTLTVPTGSFSTVNAINNKGELVGTLGAFAASYSNGAFHVISSIGPHISQANAVNDKGDIVGQEYVSEFVQHAFLYHNGQLQDLGTLAPPYTSSAAESINSEGDIVGGSGDLPFLYRNGQMQNLFSMIDPSLGWTDGDAIAINDNGWIVGRSSRGGFLMIPNITVTPEPGSWLTVGVGVGVTLLTLHLRRKP